MSDITPLFRPVAQVLFDRPELSAILDLYGRMVAAGLLRDYAIRMDSHAATFSGFERAAERPQIRVIKCPALARKQGQWLLEGKGGVVLKRGQELRSVLAPLERQLLRSIDA
jgi:Protein of unknown function (DUF2794)